jgi:hypothetical protein
MGTQVGRNPEANRPTDQGDEVTEVTEQETAEATDPVEDAIAAQMGDDETGTADDAATDATTADEGQPADADAADADSDEASAAEPEHEQGYEPSTEAVSEEIGKKLDKLQKYVANKMGDILGEDTTLFEICEVCSYTNTPGWRLSGPYPPDVELAVRHAMGQHAQTEYKMDGYSAVCDKCDGLGQTQSRSKVPGQDLLVCFGCKGRGWIPVGSERGGTPLVAQNGGTLHNEENGQTFDVIDVQTRADSPEVAALKAQGYIIIDPPALIT